MSEVCIQCSRLKGYGGCCRVPASARDAQFPITLADTQKIQDHTGKSLSEFIEIDKVVPAIESGFYKLSPLLKDQIVDGYRIKLKLREDGNCVFLEDGKGCTLGENRPLVCKLFPFWPDENGNLSPKLGSNCLAKDLADSNKSDILSMLGQKGKELLDATKDLKKNIKEHQKKMRPLLKSFNIID